MEFVQIDPSWTTSTSTDPDRSDTNSLKQVDSPPVSPENKSSDHNNVKCAQRNPVNKDSTRITSREPSFPGHFSNDATGSKHPGNIVVDSTYTDPLGINVTSSDILETKKPDYNDVNSTYMNQSCTNITQTNMPETIKQNQEVLNATHAAMPGQISTPAKMRERKQSGHAVKKASHTHSRFTHAYREGTILGTFCGLFRRNENVNGSKNVDKVR